MKQDHKTTIFYIRDNDHLTEISAGDSRYDNPAELK